MIRDLGLLTARSVVGLAFASHGAQKAFGSFGGPGPAGAAGFMESLGFKPGPRYATLSSYTELISGLSLALGLGGPLPAAGVLATMVVAATSVHGKNGFFAQNGGIELPVMYGAAAWALAFAGPGTVSLDRAFGIRLGDDGRIVWAALIAGLVGGALALRQRATATD